jgi:hypothetical protein
MFFHSMDFQMIPGRHDQDCQSFQRRAQAAHLISSGIFRKTGMRKCVEERFACAAQLILETELLP